MRGAAASRFVALALLAGAGAPLEAQTIVAPSGRALFRGATLIRSAVEIRHSSIQRDGETTDVTEYVPSVAVVYGFRPKWTFIAAQPYAKIDASERAQGSERRESSSGLGDARFFVQYDGLYRRNRPGGLTRLSGTFGLRAPTGARRVSAPGVEYSGGLIFEKAVDLRFVFTADFEHAFAVEDDEGASPGSRSRFDAASAYFVIPRSDPAPGAGWLRRFYRRAFRHGAYLVVELNGIHRSRSSEGSREIEASGGTTISISPGVQYFFSDSLLVEVARPIPVVAALRGAQPEPGGGWLFGLRYLF